MSVYGVALSDRRRSIFPATRLEILRTGANVRRPRGRVLDTSHEHANCYALEVMYRPIVLALIVAASWACSDPDRPSPPSDAGPDLDADRAEAARPGDGGMDADAGTLPAHCPSGALAVHYSLTPLSNPPSLDAIQLPGLHPATIIVPAGMGGASNSLRLDVCQEPAGPKLHAILLRGASFETVSRFVLDDAVTAPVEEFVATPQGMMAKVRLPPAGDGCRRARGCARGGCPRAARPGAR